MPIVSIVLPVYNGETYLRDSIESVLRQTYSDWELIIVDDCSTDSSLKISNSYALQDARIKVIQNEENHKLPEALNIGFRYAEGEYCTWTSDDNMYLRSSIEEMKRYLDENRDFDMVCTGMIWIDEDGRYLYEQPPYNRDSIYYENTVGASFMYRRTVIDKIGEYAPSMFCVEDLDYWIRILEAGMKIGYIPGSLYIYRYHSKSLTLSKREYVQIQRNQFFLKHIQWIVKDCDDDVMLMRIFNSLLSDETITLNEYKEYFAQTIPQIECVDNLMDKRLILYGAGQIGSTIAKDYGERVMCYCDKNKSGEELNKKSIIDIKKLKKLLNNDSYQVAISVGCDKQIDVMNDLIGAGIRSFAIIPHII